MEAMKAMQACLFLSPYVASLHSLRDAKTW